MSWVSCVLHSFFGLLATAWIIFISCNSSSTVEVDMFEYMWNDSMFKTLVVVPGLALTGLSIIYVMVINPIITKISLDTDLTDY